MRGMGLAELTQSNIQRERSAQYVFCGQAIIYTDDEKIRGYTDDEK